MLRYLLFPFALLYDVITRLRNHLFNIEYRKSIEFDRVVISVGNLNVGGSGKTPMIEYLIRLLKNERKLATLSRGYGRKTRGFHIAARGDSAKSIGDEPYQYFRKFSDNITVAVGEERALAIPEIIINQPDIDVILLDDAYQHRPVKPNVNILLTEFSRPFFKDHILPMGNLREARVGVRRADVIVVTKCSSGLNLEEKNLFKNEIAKYNPNAPVFFSGIKYSDPEPITGEKWTEPEQVILVSGIAGSHVFHNYSGTRFRKIVKHFDFADHHHYTEEEVREISSLCQSQSATTSVLTTEKDMVRLLPFLNSMTGVSWFYVPIETFFLEGGPEFDAMIRDAIKS